jgi:hypothetical protein
MDPVAVRSDRLRLDDEISASQARCFHCWSSLFLAPAEGLWTLSRAAERERSAPKLKSNSATLESTNAQGRRGAQGLNKETPRQGVSDGIAPAVDHATAANVWSLFRRRRACRTLGGFAVPLGQAARRSLTGRARNSGFNNLPLSTDANAAACHGTDYSSIVETTGLAAVQQAAGDNM